VAITAPWKRQRQDCPQCAAMHQSHDRQQRRLL
jgi:hypothetical protein